MNPNCFMTNLRLEILKRFPFLRSVKRYLSSYMQYMHLNSSPVYFRRTGFKDLPPLRDISPLSVKEMSKDNEFQVNEWLNIINQSFSRSWGEKDYMKSVINHDIYDVRHTYFLMDEDRYIGVVSEAVFKKNKHIGVTHYLGLDKEYLGQGLGKHLILYTLNKMKEHKLKSCEGESNLEHKKSLFIHFDLGFRPKAKLDCWNTPNQADVLMQAIVTYKFSRFYQEWERRKTRQITAF